MWSRTETWTLCYWEIQIMCHTHTAETHVTKLSTSVSTRNMSVCIIMSSDYFAYSSTKIFPTNFPSWNFSPQFSDLKFFADYYHFTHFPT